MSGVCLFPYLLASLGTANLYAVSCFMFLFGVICMCQGFVHSYGSLVTVRFLLGCAEVPMFPGGTAPCSSLDANNLLTSF